MLRGGNAGSNPTAGGPDRGTGRGDRAGAPTPSAQTAPHVRLSRCQPRTHRLACQTEPSRRPQCRLLRRLRRRRRRTGRDRHSPGRLLDTRVVDNTTGAPRDDADVTEITALLSDRLRRTGLPRSLRVIVRRTKLAPGETPTLFTMDGYKYSFFITSTTTLTVHLLRRPPPRACPRRGQRAHHQGHRPGHLPSKSWDVNLAWCHAVTIAKPATTALPGADRPGPDHPAASAIDGCATRLPKHWPWSAALADAITTIRRIPMPAPQPG